MKKTEMQKLFNEYLVQRVRDNKLAIDTSGCDVTELLALINHIDLYNYFTKKDVPQFSERFLELSAITHYWDGGLITRLESKKVFEFIKQNINKMIKKNNVYLVDKKKMVCVLADKRFGCLCPINKHKKDNGYSIKMSQPAIYSIWEGLTSVGKIENGILKLKK